MSGAIIKKRDINLSLYRCTSLNRLKRTAQLLILLGISLCVPVYAQANTATITVNGETIDPLEIEGYKNVHIPDGYCYPHTEKLVANRLIARKLIIDQGRLSDIKDDPLSDDETLAIEEVRSLPDDAARDLKAYSLNNLAEITSRRYLAHFFKHSMKQDLTDYYLELLSDDNPLIVNVTLVRTAKLTFNTRTEAEEVINRINAGETIDDIALELGYSGDYYERDKSTWQHAATLPAPINGSAVKPGTLFDTWFSRARWHVRQALEIKTEPVVLLDDKVDDSYFDVRYSIQLQEQRQQYQALVKELRDVAEVTIDGEPASYTDESACNFPIISNIPII